MADNSLALGLAHHADDPQQDDSPAQGDEEGEPVPAMVDVDAQRVKDQAGAESPTTPITTFIRMPEPPP